MTMARLAPSLIQIIELTLVIAVLAAIAFASRAGGARSRLPGFGIWKAAFVSWRDERHGRLSPSVYSPLRFAFL